jgi:hypothetical protein
MSIALMNASSSLSPVYAKRLDLAAQLSDRGGVVQIEEHEDAVLRDGPMIPARQEVHQRARTEHPVELPDEVDEEAVASAPAGTFPDTIRVRDFNPLDGSQGIKVYARGVGLIRDASLDLISY